MLICSARQRHTLVNDDVEPRPAEQRGLECCAVDQPLTHHGVLHGAAPAFSAWSLMRLQSTSICSAVNISDGLISCTGPRSVCAIGPSRRPIDVSNPGCVTALLPGVDSKSMRS